MGSELINNNGIWNPNFHSFFFFFWILKTNFGTARKCVNVIANKWSTFYHYHFSIHSYLYTRRVYISISLSLSTFLFIGKFLSFPLYLYLFLYLPLSPHFYVSSARYYWLNTNWERKFVLHQSFKLQGSACRENQHSKSWVSLDLCHETEIT